MDFAIDYVVVELDSVNVIYSVVFVIDVNEDEYDVESVNVND